MYTMYANASNNTPSFQNNTPSKRVRKEGVCMNIRGIFELLEAPKLKYQYNVTVSL